MFCTENRTTYDIHFFIKICIITIIARSSNGRTLVSGTKYLGSNPSLAANMS